MIFELFIALLVSLVVAYIPGYLISSIFRFDRITTFCLAPIISILLYVILGVALSALHISCHAWVIFILGSAIGIAFFFVNMLYSRTHNVRRIEVIRFEVSYARLSLLLYILIALVVTSIVFISVLESPDALAKYDDNTTHLSMIRSFLRTGSYSTLNTSAALEMVEHGAFYPAAYHVQVAINASLLNDNISLASNASLLIYLIFVLPSSLYLLFSQIFNNKTQMICGSLFTISFAAFPWGFIVFGQLLPNLISFTFIPSTFSLLICFIRRHRFVKDLPRFATIVLICLCSICVSQPNALFTLGIWFMTYLAYHFLFDFDTNRFAFGRNNVFKFALVCIFALVSWTILFYAPPLRGVVEFTWSANHTFFGALRSALLFVYTDRGGIQFFLSAMVLCGIATSLKKRKYLWLTAAYLFSLIIYVVGDSSDGFMKHFLAGFWYTDPYRTAAMNALMSIPLATLGFASLANIGAKAVQLLLKRMFPRSNSVSVVATSISTAVLTTIMAVFLFSNLATFQIGGKYCQTGLLATRDYLEWRYSSRTWLTSDEREFARKAMEVLPEGAYVFNIPNDGSEWLHGAEGLNTAYRRVVWGDMDSSNESIRGHLNEISTSEEVQEAVKELGIQYVLILDELGSENNTILDDYAYFPGKWIGIDSINEDTPGFELILSEGDMRLYKIDDKYFEN